MPLKLPKYVERRERKDGTARFIFKVPKHMRPDSWPKKPIRLKDDVGEMFRQADTLFARLKAESGGLPVQSHAEGSLPWLLQRYHQSAPYKALAPTTKDLWDGCAREVLIWSKKSGHPNIKSIDRSILFEFLELFDDKPSKKKNIATFLRALFEYAFNIGKVPANPAVRLKVSVPEPKVHIWTDEEIATIVKTADESGQPEIGTAVLIDADIGQRQGDVLKMEYGRDYADGRFLFTQNKTGEIMSFPATERVAERLKGRSSGKLVRLDETDRKQVRHHFWRRFSKVSEAAGLRHCLFAKLRHTAIVNLARAGCTHSEIASISGHEEGSVGSILKKYLPRDTKVAQNAIRKLEIMRGTHLPSG